jgi:hypothetical protein
MKVGASHFLMWKVINHLADKGATSFSLGGVTQNDSPGLERFKAGFGAKKVDLPHRSFIVCSPWRNRTINGLKLLRNSPRESLRRLVGHVSRQHYTQQLIKGRAAWLKDLYELPSDDPGITQAIDEAIAWLGRAQDNSITDDGGVARHYSLISGWGSSYPETTGYIIPTMLDFSRSKGDDETRERARRMLDWLVSIEFPEGALQGGAIGAQPCVPGAFNTGQILIGLAAGVCAFGNIYLEPMRRAADWLVNTQDADGCWRRYTSPFAYPGEKSYDTHIAWGLFEAARIDLETDYGQAGLANVEWTLGEQRGNGWFDRCCLGDPSEPLTHTIGYALRGLLEAYRFSNESRFLEAASRTADGLLTTIDKDGFIPGKLRSDWTPAVRWACLTGTLQIACCWLILYKMTGDRRYRNAAYAANRYARRRVHTNGRPETRGGVSGSFPVSGNFGKWEYLNWACKFLIDANYLESEMLSSEGE